MSDNSRRGSTGGRGSEFRSSLACVDENFEGFRMGSDDENESSDFMLSSDDEKQTKMIAAETSQSTLKEYVRMLRD